MRKITIISMILCLGAVAARAQEVTYNHDRPKMNQFTVMETGVGALTPEVFYTVAHNKYKKTAAVKNKLGYRTIVAAEAYSQIKESEKIDTSLTKRAKIEALNMTDRQVDLAWKTEGDKINASMGKFKKNIDRITTMGGDINERKRWQEYYDMFTCAISSTRNAYMPNAQRKREYLNIYADVERHNDLLVQRLVKIYSAANTEKLLAEHEIRTADKAAVVASAKSRWRDAGKRIIP